MTDYGYCYTGVRELPEHQWVRLYHYVMPVTQIRGHIATSEFKDNPLIKGHFWVPIDDTHTWTYNWFYSADPAIPVTPAFVAESEESSGRGAWSDPADRYRLTASRDNDYLLDRAAQKTRRASPASPASTRKTSRSKKAWGRAPTVRSNISARPIAPSS